MGLALVALLALLTGARGDVYIMTRTYNLDPIPDLGADFGPDVPEEGLEGQLRVADPEDACGPLTFTDQETIWVALIARQQQFHSAMNCTFDIKVRHAQEAGAAAAIVYDDEYESLIIMSKPRGHPDPLIPSVFVSQRAGLLMKQLIALEQDDGVRVRITPVSAVAWIGMVLSAVLGLLALTVVFSTFYILRSWSLWLSSGGTNTTGVRVPGQPVLMVQAHQRAPDSGLPPHVLRSLPVLIYEAAPPSRTHSLPSSMQHSQPGGSTLEATLHEDAEAPAWLHGLSPAATAPPQARDEELGLSQQGAGTDASSNSSEYEAPQFRPLGVHAGETKRTCTVCLENYVEGDKLRVLPCHHRFHMQCIDQWLSARRLCPVCKHDASKPLLQPPTHTGIATAATVAPAPEPAGNSLVNTLANMRRAWRWHSVSDAPNQEDDGAATGPNVRRAAARARLMRWLPMMRPFQRQALLAALAGELHEPLLLPGQDAAGGEHAVAGSDEPDVEAGRHATHAPHHTVAAAGSGLAAPAAAATPPSGNDSSTVVAALPVPRPQEASPSNGATGARSGALNGRSPAHTSSRSV